MLQTFILVGHVFLAVSLIALILLQRGKGAEAGTAFGAGASGTVFGSRGSASFLTRATAVLATLFFVTSLSLAFLSGQREAPTSVIEQVPQQEAPAGDTSDLLPMTPDDSDLPALPGSEPPAEADESPGDDAQ